jgi:hypothetical protein
MKKNNTRVIGFNASKFDSSDALKAYEVFAGQTDGLLAILVFQYYPYEAGAGKTFWVKDRNGIEVPVITARYSIWEHKNNRPRAGTPAKVAREIRQTVEKTPRGERPRYDWVIVHAWSWFKKASGNDENAEDMPEQDPAAAAAKGGQSIYGPVTWCAERLPASVRVVSPEELVWRIRMKHDPAQDPKADQPVSVMPHALFSATPHWNDSRKSFPVLVGPSCRSAWTRGSVSLPTWILLLRDAPDHSDARRPCLQARSSRFTTRGWFNSSLSCVFESSGADRA